MTRHSIGALVAAVLLTLVSSSASSHITLEKAEAAPRTGYKAILRVSHGCDGAPTISLEVTIPEGIIAAKPMPKPGWTIDIARGTYAKAYAFYHGSSLSKGAVSITWKGGSLPDDMYDEFVFSAYVSDAFKPGSSVAFPVVQICPGGRYLRWVEVPKAGEDAHALKAPAPTVRIVGTDDTPSTPSHQH
jgi:uncharacterized protein YcnI